MMVPVMAIIRLTQDRVGLPVALALGWPVLLAQLWLFRKLYSRSASSVPSVP